MRRLPNYTNTENNNIYAPTLQESMTHDALNYGLHNMNLNTVYHVTRRYHRLEPSGVRQNHIAHYEDYQFHFTISHHKFIEGHFKDHVHVPQGQVQNHGYFAFDSRTLRHARSERIRPTHFITMWRHGFHPRTVKSLKTPPSRQTNGDCVAQHPSPREHNRVS